MQTPGNRWKKSHPHSVRQPESPAGQHADRPSDQQAGGLSEARGRGGQKLGCADGNEHDAASKYRWVEKSKRQSYTSDLMQPCEGSAADRKMVNREAIDRNMAQYVCVSASCVCDSGRSRVWLPVCVCVCVCVCVHVLGHRDSLYYAGCRCTGYPLSQIELRSVWTLGQSWLVLSLLKPILNKNCKCIIGSNLLTATSLSPSKLIYRCHGLAEEQTCTSVFFTWFD